MQGILRIVHADMSVNSPATRGVASESTDAQRCRRERGNMVFEQQACINCHTVKGTVATGRYGPDLTHLMSRETIACGSSSEYAPGRSKAWITDPNRFKPGCLMPAMHLTDGRTQQITAYSYSH